MHGQFSGNDADLMTEINTTPLIDVMLVLLIMLMVSIPLATHRVDANLVATSGADSSAQSIHLRIAADGTLFWDQAPLGGLAELESRLRTLSSEASIQVLPAPEVSYGRVIEVLAAARRLGLTRIALPTA